MIKLKLILCSWLLPYFLWAQVPSEPCGSTMDHKAYEQYRQEVQQEQHTKSRNGRSVTLKLQPHIVRRSNGTGGLSLTDLDASIQQLNRDFASVGFYFDYCYPNYIDDDILFDEVGLRRPSEQQLGSNAVQDAFNVFFVPNTAFYRYGIPNVYPFGWGTFPYEQAASGRNWVVLNNALANRDRTLSHEVGHYFNLLHTHHHVGDGGIINGRSIPKEKVTRNPSDPCFNCDMAGDLLCDTEADPNLDQPNLSLIGLQCLYQGTLVDSCQVPYRPDTRNIMSYAYSCRLHFSQGQIDRMWAALDQYRGNITDRCSGCFPFLTVTQPVFNGQSDVQAAATSLTASNRILSGGSATYSAGNHVVLRPGFEARAGADFRGRIAYCTNQAARPVPTHRASTSLPESAVSMNIAPNPATEQVVLTFFLPEERGFAHIVLVNAQGQQVQQTLEQEAPSKGVYNVAISIREVPAGLYVVQLLTDQETIARQLIVVK